MQEYALSLGGGGGKGAYHIGVWRGLKEEGLFSHIQAFSGTSVGALNAVLMALGDYEKARRIWLSINEQMLLSPSPVQLSQAFDISNIAAILDGLLEGRRIPELLSERADGICSRQGLELLLRQLPLENLRNAAPVYINLRIGEITQAVQINDYSKEDIIQVLLAATALPGVYPAVNIHGVACRDAGVVPFHNEPFDVLCQHGHDNIIIASLRSSFDLERIPDPVAEGMYVDMAEQYPGVKFTVLKPLTDLGDLFTGTLNFSQQDIQNRMMQGYFDTVGTLNL